MAPAISVLIPTYNGAPWIRRALERIQSSADGVLCETIVADNASSDETVSLCEMTGVAVLPRRTNEGFSRAVNLAAARAVGQTLVVLNQDTLLGVGALRALHEFLQTRSGVVGGGLFSEDGRPQPSCGPFPTATATVARLLLPRRVRKYYLCPRRLDSAGLSVVDWVTGAFMAFPRSVFDAVHGFDEGFFMYYEDVDFCLRARQKNFSVYYLPSAEAMHAAPYAERRAAPRGLQKEIRLSQMRYFDKHRPRWESEAIRGLNRVYFAAKGWDWVFRK